MSSRYHEGSQRAMEVLGLRPKAKDNEIVSQFVEALGEDDTPPKNDRDGSRPLNRQSWGKSFDFSTSDQMFSGGGIQR